MIEIKRIYQLKDIEIIVKLARKIMPEIYKPMLSNIHIEYYLENFQSVQFIDAKIKRKSDYYFLLNFDSFPVGYMNIQPLENKIILDKLYILESYRGKKIGKTAIEFLDDYSNKHKKKLVELLVNRKNNKAIKFYEKSGFKISQEILTSFTNGNSVEDYRMEKLTKG